MSENQVSSCREFVNNDQETVRNLVRKVFKDFLDGNYWNWKYLQNPDFDPSLLMLAEEEGKVVGCNHWLRRDLKICNSLQVKAILGADLIVDPEYRGRGIGRLLMQCARGRVKKVVKEGVVLRYMFANPDLSKKLYTPVAGYFPAPCTTISYFKILDWSKLISKINVANKQKQCPASKRRGLKVLFNLSGAPPLLLELYQEKVEPSQCSDPNPDVVLTSDLYTLSSIKANKKRLRALFWALFIRKIKIRGNLLNIIKLYKNFWLIEQIFSEKIS